ncbi:hypothetical protein ACX8XN_05230 [Calditrichota bacterium GD2]
MASFVVCLPNDFEKGEQRRTNVEKQAPLAILACGEFQKTFCAVLKLIPQPGGVSKAKLNVYLFNFMVNLTLALTPFPPLPKIGRGGIKGGEGKK